MCVPTGARTCSGRETRYTPAGKYRRPPLPDAIHAASTARVSSVTPSPTAPKARTLPTLASAGHSLVGASQGQFPMPPAHCGQRTRAHGGGAPATDPDGRFGKVNTQTHPEPRLRTWPQPPSGGVASLRPSVAVTPCRTAHAAHNTRGSADKAAIFPLAHVQPHRLPPTPAVTAPAPLQDTHSNHQDRDTWHAPPRDSAYTLHNGGANWRPDGTVGALESIEPPTHPIDRLVPSPARATLVRRNAMVGGSFGARLSRAPQTAQPAPARVWWVW
jgi:hypothetical protein